MQWFRIGLVVGSIALLAGCEGEEPSVTAPLTCTVQADCPGVSYCQDGICVKPASTTCTSDQDCPAGSNCQPSGECVAANVCETDSECCFGAPVPCMLQCVSGECVGSECTTGVQDACFVGCNKGTKVCENGSWSLCSAPPVADVETCDDGIDNDCNGTTDEGCPECTPGETIPCSSECGEGEMVCSEQATWLPCDASTDCTCNPGEVKSEPCGNCGFEESTCSPEGKWLQAGLCQSEGECEAGSEEILSCGSCGSQVRICSDECTWGAYSECVETGECEPGSTQSSSCGICGAEELTCNAECQWEVTIPCNENAGCGEGEQQTVPCGLCGVQISECDATCQWGEFGECVNEGVCTPGTTDEEACGPCGSRTRSCREDCQWEEWSECSDPGECTPGEQQTEVCGPSSAQGICEKGERERSCGTGCMWDAWSSCFGAVYAEDEICGNGVDEDCNGVDLVIPDAYEPNNSCASCYYLGEDPNIVLLPTTDNPYDVDYFCFDANDSLSPLENIKVKLKDQPIGMDNDIFLYKGYEACEESDHISASVTIGGQDESLSWGEASLSDDGGLYIIRVQPYEASSCYMPYTLEINGLN